MALIKGYKLHLALTLLLVVSPGSTGHSIEDMVHVDVSVFDKAIKIPSRVPTLTHLTLTSPWRFHKAPEKTSRS